jgi:putative nucleotidyltransferase with HDIG domain
LRKNDLRLEKLLFNLDALADLGAVLTSPNDFQRIVKSSLYMTMGSFSASRGAIFQFDHKNKTICPMVTKGTGDISDIVLRLDETAIREMIILKRPVNLDDSEKMAKLLGTVMAELKKIKVSILMPLVVREDFLGFIVISDKFSGDHYTKDDFRLLSVISHHIAVSLYSHSLMRKLMSKYDENKRLYENLSHIYYDTIHAFAAAIDAKDTYTKGHSHRVSAYCAALAEEMMLSDEEAEGIRIAGLLHDIGKIAIDRSIINKDSPLTKAERTELNLHPVVGYEILSKVRFPWDGITGITRNHHERVDGNGYPDGLKGKDIPIGVRIMSLADSFDAMTTDRPYRPALSASYVLMELQKNSNKQFDSNVVQSFFNLLSKEVAGENKPVVMSLLNREFADEIKSIVLSRDFDFLNTSIKRA